jgi:hypothetical protein
MALQVIGSGFGRTGTMSLKMALEELGLGPCHHMAECMGNPANVPAWVKATAGEPVDWTEVFDAYSSQVDWPGAAFWREIFEAYPDAKVIHSVRPEEKWWASFSQTIAKFMSQYEQMPLPPHIQDMIKASISFIGDKSFGGNWADKDTAIAAFRQRTEDVKAAIPAGQLLIFDVVEGWEPLCAFLGVPVPSTPFPRSNNTEEFWQHFGPQA